MTRLIENVHDRIMKVIPETETALIKDLEKFINSIWNKAPEVRCGPEVYTPYYNILWNHGFGEIIKGHDPDWMFQVRDIFADRI
jgi:hypothetical protein